MKIATLLFIIFTVSVHAAGYHEAVIFSPGFVWQKENMAELNIGYGFVDSGSGYVPISSMATVRIGAERSVSAEQVITAFKLGAEFTITVLTARLNVAQYASGSDRDIRFIPEIGVACLNYCSLTYGHSSHIGGDKIEKVGKNRIGFVINIPFAVD